VRAALHIWARRAPPLRWVCHRGVRSAVPFISSRLFSSGWHACCPRAGSPHISMPSKRESACRDSIVERHLCGTQPSLVCCSLWDAVDGEARTASRTLTTSSRAMGPAIVLCLASSSAVVGTATQNSEEWRQRGRRMLLLRRSVATAPVVRDAIRARCPTCVAILSVRAVSPSNCSWRGMLGCRRSWAAR